MVHKDPEKHVFTETESESKHEETVEQHSKEQDGLKGPEKKGY